MEINSIRLGFIETESFLNNKLLIANIMDYNSWKSLKVGINKYSDYTDNMLKKCLKQLGFDGNGLLPESIRLNEDYRIVLKHQKISFNMLRTFNSLNVSKKYEKQLISEYGRYNLPRESNNYHGII